MGQMINEDDCEVCVPFDQEWIFTYGDLVTLLMCFFVLLFSMCKMDVEKIDQISDSLKTMPPGSPFVFSGRSSNLEKAAQELEQLDMPDDVNVNAGKDGVEVTFSKIVAFDLGSTELKKEAREAIDLALPVIGSLPNDIMISGHTDETDANPKFPSNWELSIARAGVIATYLQSKEIPKSRIQVAGFGDSRPRFFPDTPYKRGLNRRVEIVLLPEDQER
ncbi:MAG: OmpA/MotB family protein [bacterium]|jgi:chemotaxis protein MotB